MYRPSALPFTATCLQTPRDSALGFKFLVVIATLRWFKFTTTDNFTSLPVSSTCNFWQYSCFEDIYPTMCSTGSHKVRMDMVTLSARHSSFLKAGFPELS